MDNKSAYPIMLLWWPARRLSKRTSALQKYKQKLDKRGMVQRQRRLSSADKPCLEHEPKAKGSDVC